MAADGKLPQRRSIRIADFDYSELGAYFVTICSKKRSDVFGKVMKGRVELSEPGRRVERCWAEIPHHFPFVELDEYVVMPNHIHGIILIVAEANDETRTPVRRGDASPRVRRGVACYAQKHGRDRILRAQHAAPLHHTRWARDLHLSGLLYDHSNPRPPGKSAACERPSPVLYGNATITNT